MKLNDKGYDLIKKFEGYSDKPYKCPAGIPTIGYGNTYYPNGVKVKLTDKPITKEYANEILAFIADNFAKDVLKVVKSNISVNQLNALTAFAYNLGMTNFRNSSLLKLVNHNPNDANIAKEFLKWNKANGKVLNGLTNRRIAESALYFTK
ncbi:lysozyme [Flavobacterium sp.]|uniref:lysozyme n=1 Tax=Flavobacterium sp. TaxID=239 RepID=UPI0025F19103|nr:lysozyme [Flavobacterium sp.]